MTAGLKKTALTILVIAIVLVVVAGANTAADFGGAVGDTINGLGGFFTRLWDATLGKWIAERGGDGGTATAGLITLRSAVATVLPAAA